MQRVVRVSQRRKRKALHIQKMYCYAYLLAWLVCKAWCLELRSPPNSFLFHFSMLIWTMYSNEMSLLTFILSLLNVQFWWSLGLSSSFFYLGPEPWSVWDYCWVIWFPETHDEHELALHVLPGYTLHIYQHHALVYVTLFWSKKEPKKMITVENPINEVHILIPAWACSHFGQNHSFVFKLPVTNEIILVD